VLAPDGVREAQLRPVLRHPHLHIDRHHPRHWAQGGSTDVANLVAICRAHHWKVYEGGWRLIRTDEGVVALPPVADDYGPGRGSSRPRAPDTPSAG
jgi:hypothetical protein